MQIQKSQKVTFTGFFKSAEVNGADFHSDVNFVYKQSHELTLEF